MLVLHSKVSGQARGRMLYGVCDNAGDVSSVVEAKVDGDRGWQALTRGLVQRLAWVCHQSVLGHSA